MKGITNSESVKIRHFLYNAFLIEGKDVKLAIDPGQNLSLFNLTSLIPEEEWKDITHVLVTHGDPDHYWQADRVAKVADSPLILNRSMVRQEGLERQILGPRSRGLTFVPYAGKVLPLDVGVTMINQGVKISGIKSVHGPLEIKILGSKKRIMPGPNERAGFGSMGFKIDLHGKTFVNLGDSLLQQEWAGLKPDVLMLPIGGLGNQIWTMDVTEAIEAVKLISPKLVIPCHYNVPFLWKKTFAPADAVAFKREIENLGIDCVILNYGEEIKVKARSKEEVAY